MDINILIGGEAGQGLKTISQIMGKTFFRMGYNVFSTQNYMSRIRGGHNFTKIRISTKKANGPADNIDVLIALNKETVSKHKDQLSPDGVILYDGENIETKKEMMSVPAKEIAEKINIRGLNTVFIGAVHKILGFDLNEVKEVIKDYFSKDNIIEDNLKLLEKGYNQVDVFFSQEDIKKALVKENKEKLFINGNEAAALGALAAGLDFYSAYPMSPSTGIMSYIAGKQKDMGVVVEQAEDEIAAANIVLGAAYSGIRAMTATSGGGLSLMAESLGLAGITETPLVIVNVERPGPATGLPTRTEQGDLQFSINISQGEFPLMVMSIRDQEDAFYQTFRALNIADKYQIPVIILSDQFLADSSTNVKKFNLDSLKLETSLISEDEFDEEFLDGSHYQRYKITEDGISPRAYPGQISGEVVLVDSDEHDENGNIIEDAETRSAMVEKRRRKLQRLKVEDLQEPKYYGQDNIDYLLIGWGSTYGPLSEALNLLQLDNINAGYLSFNDLWPFPGKKLMKLIEDNPKTVVIENNSTGQLANLIRQETGIKADNKILKYDGRPFTGKELYQRIVNEVIDND